RSEGTMRPVRVENAALHGGIRSLGVDRDGLLWIGTVNGLVRFDGTVWSTLRAQDGLPGETTYAIAQAPDGAMWFGTEGGLVRYPRSRVAPAGPSVTVRTARTSRPAAAVPALVQGRWATFRFAAADANTPASRRQYRVEVKQDETGATNLLSIQSEPQF